MSLEEIERILGDMEFLESEQVALRCQIESKEEEIVAIEEQLHHYRKLLEN